jgi:hypothetical protein
MQLYLHWHAHLETPHFEVLSPVVAAASDHDAQFTGGHMLQAILGVPLWLRTVVFDACRLGKTIWCVQTTLFVGMPLQ